jgi:hypothetical protein
MDLVLLLISAIVCGISWLVGLFAMMNEDETTGKIATIITLISFAVIIFCFVGGGIAGNQPWVRDKEPYKVEYLYSLEDNNLTSGRGYYRRVRIDTDLYYQYMYKSGSGYKYNKVKANQATVFEDDTTPRVEFYEMRKKWFIFEETCKVYRIYVPKATIAEDYNIDLG